MIALAHARVIDGTGAPPRDDQTIIVRDGNIADLGTPGALVKGLLVQTRAIVTPQNEAIYDTMPKPLGFAAFAPLEPARGRLFSARARAEVAGEPTEHEAVTEEELYRD